MAFLDDPVVAMTVPTSTNVVRELQAPDARYWTAQTFGERGPEVWSVDVDDDVQALAVWAQNQSDPVGVWQWGEVATPAIEYLASAVACELQDGTGVVRLAPPSAAVENPDRLRLFYLALGTALGSVAKNYGRLYDVKDRGVSYRTQSVPVSMTRESTGMHTDSSARDFEPDYVGLLCVRNAPHGGRSRVVSAATVYRHLRAKHPELAQRLRQPFIRDVVTPGYERDLAHVKNNAFPVFSDECGMTFRYMRYWIESGHRSCDEPLTEADVAAFDALDSALHDPAVCVEFSMEPGEQLWVANRTIAHDRTAYIDDVDAPRLMIRQWVTVNQGTS